MPLTMSSSTAQPSASGPSTSHRNTGTPSSRSIDSTFGTVSTRSVWTRVSWTSMPSLRLGRRFTRPYPPNGVGPRAATGCSGGGVRSPGMSSPTPISSSTVPPTSRPMPVG